MTSLSSRKPSASAMQQGAEWYAILRSGDASQAEQRQWQQWVNACSENRLAWQYVEAVSKGIMPLHTHTDPHLTKNNLLISHQTMRQRRNMLFGLLAISGGSMLGWMSWRYSDLPSMVLVWGASYRTGTGEIREFALPDQGTLWLDTASAVNLDYQTNLRRLELLRGRILVQTASDTAQRPFVVDSCHGRMRALGTRLMVCKQKEHTQLTVYEGAVQITPANTSDAAILVSAGEQVTFDRHRELSRAPANPVDQAWFKGILPIQDTSLGELVEILSGYHSGHISVADSVAERRIFGSFPLRDIPATLNMLASSQSLKLRKISPWWWRITEQ